MRRTLLHFIIFRRPEQLISKRFIYSITKHFRIKRLNTAAGCNLIIYIFLFWAISVQAQLNSKYNIIFISVDDMNDRLGILGNNEVLTPNLKRLAERCMVFTNSFTQYPLCNPSRASFLLGWRPDKTRITNNQVRPRTVIGPDVKFLPEYFKSNGYRIESYGKTLHHTFESDIVWNYFEPPEGEGSDEPFDPSEKIKWWIKNPDSLDLDMKEVGNFVAKLKTIKKTTPFFLCLGFLSPHNPFTPNLKYWNLYGDSSVQELLPINENGDFLNITGNGSAPIVLPTTPPNDRSDVPPIAFLEHPSIILPDSDWKRTIHAYDAEVSELDAQLGQVLDEMDRQNLWENTIVVFISDHGQHLGEHEGTWRKRTLFNESLHVPLLICVPGKKAGICSRIIESVDVYPTLADLCGLAQPPGMEGISFAPLLNDPTLSWKKAAFSQCNRKDSLLGTIMGRTICTERFRYTSWGKGGEELYDHKKDPHEYTNLVTNLAYADRLNRMRRILARGWAGAIPPKSSTNLKSVTTAQVSALSENESRLSAGLELFPNPSNGRINVKYNSSGKSEIDVRIYNVMGTIMFTKIERAIKGNNNYTFNLAGLKPGTYYLEINNSGKQKQVKFIIEK